MADLRDQYHERIKTLTDQLDLVGSDIKGRSSAAALLVELSIPNHDDVEKDAFYSQIVEKAISMALLRQIEKIYLPKPNRPDSPSQKVADDIAGMTESELRDFIDSAQDERAERAREVFSKPPKPPTVEDLLDAALFALGGMQDEGGSELQHNEFIGLHAVGVSTLAAAQSWKTIEDWLTGSAFVADHGFGFDEQAALQTILLEAWSILATLPEACPCQEFNPDARQGNGCTQRNHKFHRFPVVGVTTALRWFQMFWYNPGSGEARPQPKAVVDSGIRRIVLSRLQAQSATVVQLRHAESLRECCVNCGVPVFPNPPRPDSTKARATENDRTQSRPSRFPHPKAAQAEKPRARRGMLVLCHGGAGPCDHERLQSTSRYYMIDRSLVQVVVEPGAGLDSDNTSTWQPGPKMDRHELSAFESARPALPRNIHLPPAKYVEQPNGLVYRGPIDEDEDLHPHYVLDPAIDDLRRLLTEAPPVSQRVARFVARWLLAKNRLSSCAKAIFGTDKDLTKDEREAAKKLGEEMLVWLREQVRLIHNDEESEDDLIERFNARLDQRANDYRRGLESP